MRFSVAKVDNDYAAAFHRPPIKGWHVVYWHSGRVEAVRFWLYLDATRVGSGNSENFACMLTDVQVVADDSGYTRELTKPR